MTTLVAVAIVIALVFGVIRALQHHVQRPAALGRVPFGLDREGGNDRDRARIRSDLNAIAAHHASLPRD